MDSRDEEDSSSSAAKHNVDPQKSTKYAFHVTGEVSLEGPMICSVAAGVTACKEAFVVN